MNLIVQEVTGEGTNGSFYLFFFLCSGGACMSHKIIIFLFLCSPLVPEYKCFSSNINNLYHSAIFVRVIELVLMAGMLFIPILLYFVFLLITDTNRG